MWCLLLGLLMITAVCAAAGAPAPTCESLREKNARVRWLSLPQSRIVVNPFGLEPITLPEGLAPCLKTDLAYYAGEKPVKLPCFWAWRVSGEQAASPRAVSGPAADFASNASGQWAQSQAKAEFGLGGMRVSVTAGAFGSATHEFTVDLDETPYLVLQVAAADGQWALKVNDGTKPVDVSLEMGAWGPGTYTYDVRAATGWSGKKTFRVLLFAVGQVGSWTQFSGLRFVGTQEGSPKLAGSAFAWAPHALESSAEFAKPQTKIESAIFMPDESTIAQVVRVADGDPGTLALTGQFSQARVEWDAAQSAVVLRADHYSARICVSGSARWLGTHDSWPGILAAEPQPEQKSGVWAVAIDGVKPGDEIIVEAQFAPAKENLPDKVPNLATASVKTALKARETDWDKRLAELPQPADFALHRVDPKQTTPEAVRRMYYKAWVFLLQDTLPPMPENDYSYPQVCCGKPSLWAEGHPKSRPSAQWESMIGMQFLGLVDSETAWKSFEGMMTLVDKDGIMGGEGLPSRHAQTAWILYSSTSDAKRLKKVYPAIKRLLLWKISDPRWVFKDLTTPGSKDLEFVVHALIDAGFAARIAEALKMPEETRFWQGEIRKLAAQADLWFWDDNGTGPYEIYDASTGKRGAIHSPWNLQALALPKGLLTKQHERSVVDLLKSMISPNAPFAGTILCKHPTYQFTMLGAWKRGLRDEAAIMAEAIMREITMCGEFSECYSYTFPPKNEGVTPSLFGVCNMIDGTLWHNGVILGEGLPLNAGSGAAKVRNLKTADK